MYCFKAIDDIYISPFSCSRFPNCDFENPDLYDYCSWLNIDQAVNIFNWEIHSSALNPSFGIVPDYTLQSPRGHFILANSVKKGNYARLYSESVDSTSSLPLCFSFYYYFNAGKPPYSFFIFYLKGFKFAFNLLRLGLQFDNKTSRIQPIRRNSMAIK